MVFLKFPLIFLVFDEFESASPLESIASTNQQSYDHLTVPENNVQTQNKNLLYNFAFLM